MMMMMMMMRKLQALITYMDSGLKSSLPSITDWLSK